MPQHSSTDLLAEITEKFAPHTTPGSDSLLSECVKLCQIFNVSPTELFFKWEALFLNATNKHSSIARELDMQSILNLKSALQQKPSTQPATLSGVMSRNALGGLHAKKRLADPHTSNFSSSTIRTHPIQVKREANENKIPVLLSGPSSRVKFARSEHSAGKTYRYMYEKLSERGNALDDRIDDFAEIVMQHFNLDEFGDPSTATNNDVVVVGRIVSDTETPALGSVRLNDTSIMLETSRMMGSGVRVPLRFDVNCKIPRRMSGFALFPGLIVSLKGKNGGGGWFSVSEVLSIPPLRPPTQITKSDANVSFTMCIASGPYTSNSDLLYNPWHDLMASITRDKPDVVLLMGPFIDNSHSHIKTGDIDEAPSDMFRTQFEQRFDDLLATLPTLTLLIVPSVQDILNQHTVFPQPEIELDFVTDHRVHFLPNPCRFTLNEVSFAVSTVDVLFHLKKEEFVKRSEPIESALPPSDSIDGDAMGSLCRHLLQQRSFYPIFPVPVDYSQDVNLDISHPERLALGEDHAPHVLVLPSRLKHFSKAFDGTTTINPSFLSKGTFASLSFLYSGDGDVKDSIDVEIRKLNQS